LVRENQQSSVHNFVKDFSSTSSDFSSDQPPKKGAGRKISPEYRKAEVQTLFEPLQSVH